MLLPNVLMPLIFSFVPDILHELWTDAIYKQEIKVRNKCMQWKPKTFSFPIDSLINKYLLDRNYTVIQYLLSVEKPSFACMFEHTYNKTFITLLSQYNYLSQNDLRVLFSNTVHFYVDYNFPDIEYLNWFVNVHHFRLTDVINSEKVITHVCKQSQNPKFLDWLIEHQFPLPEKKQFRDFFMKAAKENRVSFMQWCIDHQFITWVSTKEVGILKRTKRPHILEWIKRARIPIIKAETV